MRAGAALLLAVALAIRLWAIGSEPLWLDEAYSAYAADHGFAFLWQIVPRYETHPPFYYSLLRLWTLVFGNGLLALRAPGVIAGLTTLPLTVKAADEAGRWLGWKARRRRDLRFAALAFACVAIPLVAMTREVRPYPLMILVYAGALLALLRLARRTGEGRGIGGGLYVLYLALVEAMLWLHNLGPFHALALTLALAVAVLRPGLRRRDWVWLAGGHVIVAALYLPALRIMLDQAPTWVHSTWLRFGIGALADHLPMLYAAPGWPCLAGLVLVVLAIGGAWHAPAGRRLVALLLILALLPVMLSVAVSVAIAPVFITRTMTPVAVPALSLFAIGAVAWRDWRRCRTTWAPTWTGCCRCCRS